MNKHYDHACSRLLVVTCGLTAAGAMASNAYAQEFEALHGGNVLEAWAEPHPSVPGEFLAFTAEVGVRIRRIDTATDTISFEEIDDGEDIHGALHDVFISDDLRWGFAVGSDGQAYWATDLATPSTWHELNPIPEVAGNHLWGSFWDSDWEGSVWEREAWIVGEGPTLLHKPRGEVDFSEAVLTPPAPVNSKILSIDFGDLEGSDDARFGAVGLFTRTTDSNGVPMGAGDSVPAIYISSDGVSWVPASVELPQGWGTGRSTGGVL